MEITVKQPQTFIGCPLQHQFFFLENNSVIEDELTLHEKMYFDLQQLIEYNLTEELLGHNIPESVLRNRLALMWRTKIDPTDEDYKFNTYGNLVMSEAEKILKAGYETLHRYFNWRNSSPRFKAISINENFRIRCGRHYLVGQLPVVRYCERYNHFTLLDIRSSDIDATLSEKHYMTYASWCIAFEYIYDREINEIIILWLDRKGKQMITKVSLDPWKKQYLKRLVDQVGHAIQLRVVYPIKGNKCQTCPFTKACQSWLIYGPRKPLFAKMEEATNKTSWEEPEEEIEGIEPEVEETIQIIR